MTASPGPARPYPTGAFDIGEGDVAVLCLHGLTGQPYEIRPVAEALARAGMRAVGPVLPGHEGEVSALTETFHGDWLRSVREAYGDLRRRHEAVMVVGLSLGGLLALSLAAEEDVHALAVIGTPIELRFPIPQLVPWVRALVPYVQKRRGSDIRDAEARERHPSFDQMPLHAVHELTHLQRHVRKVMPRITQPVFVAHGAHDTTANPDDAAWIESAVSSEHRELLMLPNSGHIVPVDHDGEALADAVSAFFSKLV